MITDVTNTMTSELEKIDVLKQLILKNEKQPVIEYMEALKSECLTTVELSNTVTTPVVITELHKMLVEHMGVNQRAMQLRNRIPNTTRRAMLFLQAMINGVNISNGVKV